MDSGVATRPIKDFEAYRAKLQEFFVQSQLIMRPICLRAKDDPKRIVYCEGEEERVLQAVQSVLDDGVAKPILIGRKKVIETRIERLGLRMKAGKDFELVDPENDSRYRIYWEAYHDIMQRRGVTPSDAQMKVRTNTTIIGALMVYLEDADAVICGTVGHYKKHLKNVIDIIGLKPGVETAATMTGLLVNKGIHFICDTHINPDPSIAQLSEMTLLAAKEVKRFGITPKVAMLSHSNFGSNEGETAHKMRKACIDIRQRDPSLEIDGEMHADTALSPDIRERLLPDSTLTGPANLFMMPNVEAANITYNMVKILANGIVIGPLLLGAAKPAHIMTSAASARGIINMTAIATVTAQVHEAEQKKTA